MSNQQGVSLVTGFAAKTKRVRVMLTYKQIGDATDTAEALIDNCLLFMKSGGKQKVMMSRRRYEAMIKTFEKMAMLMVEK